MQTVKKGTLSISDYTLKIKLLANELEGAGCDIFEEEKFVNVLSRLYEDYDNVFSMLTKRMITEKVIANSHECKLERRKVFIMLTLPSPSVI